MKAVLTSPRRPSEPRWSRLRDSLSEVARDCGPKLLEAYSIRAIPTCAPDNPAELVAVLRFRGPHFRGSVGIAASPALLRRSLKNVGIPEAELALVQDCLAELSNQLLGRMKNLWRDLGVGVEVQAAATVLHRGLTASMAGTPDAVFAVAHLDCSGETVTLWVDGILDPQFVAEPRECVGPFQVEGSVLFF